MWNILKLEAGQIVFEAGKSHARRWAFIFLLWTTKTITKPSD